MTDAELQEIVDRDADPYQRSGTVCLKDRRKLLTHIDGQDERIKELEHRLGDVRNIASNWSNNKVLLKTDAAYLSELARK